MHAVTLAPPNNSCARENPSKTGNATPRRLKILFVTNMYPDAANPGAGAFVYQQAQCLRREGHHVDVLRVEGQRSRLEYITAAVEVSSKTRATPYDVVHAHYGLSGFPALFRWKTPLVVTLHGSDALRGRMQPFISRVVCSFADEVIVVSKGISERIDGEIIPCGVDLNVFRPLDRIQTRTRLGLPPRAKIILFPFDPARKIKRYDLAQNAVAALQDPNTQILTVFGKSNEDMPLYYNAADVMILCSESEGSPTSVKEALACNLPVVSTDVGDVREIVQGIEGCEICHDDVQSLAQGIGQVLGRGTTKPFDGSVAMQRYDQKRVITAIINVYNRAIHRRRIQRN